MSDELKLKLMQELAKGNVRIGQFILEVQGNNYYNERSDKEEKVKLKD